MGFIESENQATEQTEGEGENTLGNEIKDCTYNIETLSKLLDGILIDKAILTTESNSSEVTKGEMEKRHLEKEETCVEKKGKCEEKQETCEENKNIHIEKEGSHVEKEDMHVEKEKIQTGKDKTYLEITETEKPILPLEATTSIDEKTKPSLESEPELTQTENQSNQVNLKGYETNLVKEFNSFMETEENVSNHLVANKDEHHITTESNSFKTTEKKQSNKEENYLVTEINHFMETEEKHLKKEET